MGPDMLLRLKLILVRSFKLETEGGMGPVKALPSQYSSSSFGLLPRMSGNSPLKPARATEGVSQAETEEGGATDARLTAEVAVEMGEVCQCGEPLGNRPADRIPAELRLLQVDQGFHAWRKVRHVVQVHVQHLQPRQCLGEGRRKAPVEAIPFNVQLSDAAPAVGPNFAADPLPVAD